MILSHKIAGARSHEIRRRFLTDGVGNNDQGNIDIQVSNQGNRLRKIKVRQIAAE